MVSVVGDGGLSDMSHNIGELECGCVVWLHFEFGNIRDDKVELRLGSICIYRFATQAAVCVNVVFHACANCDLL
jgi:hypothetical protein